MNSESRISNETVFPVRRLSTGPIITPDMDDRMGANINGPSLILAPDWLPGRLGKYYLYFAHHHGTYIRLAYADDLLGPWRIHQPGVLDMSASLFDDHLASPDVHVDHERRQIRMYYHGRNKSGPVQVYFDGSNKSGTVQKTRVALSPDGLHFSAREGIVADWYARLFTWDGAYYLLTMPGRISRSPDGMAAFEDGPLLFNTDMRHSAPLLCGHELFVFYTNVGDSPERILLSRIDLRGDWMRWRETPPVTVLKPEMDFEGADLPVCVSTRGAIHQKVNQLRDPAVYVEHDRVYLLYAVAGESGLALAEVLLLPATRNPVAFEPGLIRTPRIGTARQGESESC